MKKPLNNLRGAGRLFVAVSIIWFVLANYLYFTGLGATYFVSLTSYGTRPLPPEWQQLWSTVTSGSEAIRLYERLAGEASNGAFPYETGYRAIGHAFFVGLPILFASVLYTLGKWVKNGFASNEHYDRR